MKKKKNITLVSDIHIKDTPLVRCRCPSQDCHGWFVPTRINQHYCIYFLNEIGVLDAYKKFPFHWDITDIKDNIFFIHQITPENADILIKQVELEIEPELSLINYGKYKNYY